MIPDWFLPLSGWLVGVSIVTFVAGLLLVPFIVARLPQDFFVREETVEWRWPESPLGWLIWSFRNVLGVFLIVPGIAMLIAPGQGLLTIAAGIMLTTLPGKRRFVLWLVHFGGMQHTLNWIRKKAHKPPLLFPERTHVHVG